MADAPLRVLIVDDEAPARHRLRELLEDCAAVLPLARRADLEAARHVLRGLVTWGHVNIAT